MQINDTTYETIFLLYIDKELSQEESLEVDAFIAANPNYALLMEELKATVVAPEKLGYPFKANLKQPIAETDLETIEEDEDEVENWSQTYSNYLMQDMQAIPGLSTQFKNGLKKEAPSTGILVKPFGFNKNKFAYAAVAALFMVFLGYQQLTKAPSFNMAASNFVAVNTQNIKVGQLLKESNPAQANNTISRNSQSNPSLVQNKNANSFDQSTAESNLIAPNVNSATVQFTESNKNIAIVEPIELNTTARNTTIPEKVANALTNTSTSAMDTDTELATDATAPVSYEIIDTDDPNRTIYIANLEIDGNKLRGLKRKVGSIFKNNKSERNK